MAPMRFSLYEDWGSGYQMTVIVHVAGCRHTRESNCDHDEPEPPEGLRGVVLGPFDSYEDVYHTINDNADPLDAWAPADCTVCRPWMTQLSG